MCVFISSKTQEKLVKKSDYPYKGVSGVCHYFSQSHSGVSMSNFMAHDFRYGPAIVQGHTHSQGFSQEEHS